MQFFKPKKFKILFVGSEAAPFIKVGGLGEVLYALPMALAELGHDVRVMIPKYSTIDSEKFPMEMTAEHIAVPNPEGEDLICNVKEYKNGEKFINYFLENEEYYEKRGSVYGYDDDAARWALLARGTLEFIRSEHGWKPDIIVANDWQGGLIPNYLRCEYEDDPKLEKIAVIFVIHNIHFQGTIDYRHQTELDYDDGQSAIPAITEERITKLNFMRRGIRYADVINTVSPTYAREITTPEYGELLDPLLAERRSRLFGILNGINYDQYNPKTNPYVEYPYEAEDVHERQKNKKILQQKFNLPEREDVFVAAIVSRLADQKGLDLVLETIEPLLKNFDFQFVILGTGDSKYIAFFDELGKKYPEVATHLSYDPILPHVIYAGADAIMLPSRFEPSGLTQMEAMRYGAIPIVRKVGGLTDSVTDYNPEENTGTGFGFDSYEPYALVGAFVRAHTTYHYPKMWKGIVERAMKKNFSWEHSAQDYVKLFERALNQFSS
jgi:starch synthase